METKLPWFNIQLVSMIQHSVGLDKLNVKCIA